MASIKVADYFAGSGGAANDSTDCTAAFQAALDALHTAGRNGELILPEGICRFTAGGSVSKAFDQSGSPQGQIVIRGQGSAIRFMGSAATRFEVTGSQTLICRNVTFLGDTSSGSATEATQSHVHLEGHQIIYENNLHYGLGMASDGLNRGLVWLQGAYQSIVKGCQWRGNWGNIRPNLYVYGCDSVRVEDTIFIDYGVYQSTSYSKGGAGCTYWIDIDNDGGSNENFGKVIINNLYFDEGAQTSHIRIKNLEWAQVLNSYANVSGAGRGFEFENVQTVEVGKTNLGYAAVANKVGIKATNIGLLRLQDVRLIPGGGENGVDTVELLGATRKVIEENCSRGSTGNHLPIIYTNTANAEIVRDGIKTKNGLTDYN